MTNLSIGTTSIRQLDGLYNLNDIHKVSGAERSHQPSNFLRLEQTRELIAEIKSSDLRIYKKADISAFTESEKIKCPDIDISNIEPVKSERGCNGGTFACRELVYAYAMWISPKFHLAVIRAFDRLNNSGQISPAELPSAASQKTQYHVNIIQPDGSMDVKPLDAGLLIQMMAGYPELAIIRRADLNEVLEHSTKGQSAAMQLSGFSRGLVA